MNLFEMTGGLYFGFRRWQKGQFCFIITVVYVVYIVYVVYVVYHITTHCDCHILRFGATSAGFGATSADGIGYLAVFRPR